MHLIEGKEFEIIFIKTNATRYKTWKKEEEIWLTGFVCECCFEKRGIQNNLMAQFCTKLIFFKILNVSRKKGVLFIY